MTGPAHEVETSYPPSPRGLRSFGERSAVGGGQKAVEEADSVRYYTWARDLSGSLQGAGGVGGLLAITEGNTTTSSERSTRNEEQGTNGETRFALYDANGNVGQLINTTGAVVAAYTYDPFGNVTEMAGTEAAENPWRFSTKPVEAGTGWLYYGYRWYDGELGRWASRDPIEESGGVNLYGFVGNDGVGMVDVLGLVAQARRVAIWRIRTVELCKGWCDSEAAKSGKELEKYKNHYKSLSWHPPIEEAYCCCLWKKGEKCEKGDNLEVSVPSSGPVVKDGEKLALVTEMVRTKNFKCHHCGNDLRANSSFVGDHQPPTALNTAGNPQTLHPQCHDCSASQGGQVNACLSNRAAFGLCRGKAYNVN